MEAVVNRFKAGFKGGSDESVTAMTEISKVEFNFTATVDEQALAFRNKYCLLYTSDAADEEDSISRLPLTNRRWLFAINIPHCSARPRKIFRNLIWPK